MKFSTTLLCYAAVCLGIGVVAALLGFAGAAAGAASVAKVLALLFLIVFFVSLIAGLFRRG